MHNFDQRIVHKKSDTHRQDTSLQKEEHADIDLVIVQSICHLGSIHQEARARHTSHGPI